MGSHRMRKACPRLVFLFLPIITGSCTNNGASIGSGIGYFLGYIAAIVGLLLFVAIVIYFILRARQKTKDQ